MFNQSSEDEEESETSSLSCPAPVFTELLELLEYSDGAREWKEVARWVKFEETVEEAGNRLSSNRKDNSSERVEIIVDGASRMSPLQNCREFSTSGDSSRRASSSWTWRRSTSRRSALP